MLQRFQQFPIDMPFGLTVVQNMNLAAIAIVLTGKAKVTSKLALTRRAAISPQRRTDKRIIKMRPQKPWYSFAPIAVSEIQLLTNE